MAVSGLSFRNALVDSGLATAVLLCMNSLRNSLHAFHSAISAREALFPIWASSCWLKAVTIASLLMGGCGWSNEHMENGCKSTCVKFGALKLDRTIG